MFIIHLRVLPILTFFISRISNLNKNLLTVPRALRLNLVNRPVKRYNITNQTNKGEKNGYY